MYVWVVMMQVREQSKINAAKLRESVQQEKDRLLRELAVQLQVINVPCLIDCVVFCMCLTGEHFTVFVRTDPCCYCCLKLAVNRSIQCESKNLPPFLRFSGNFSQTAENF